MWGGSKVFYQDESELLERKTAGPGFGRQPMRLLQGSIAETRVIQMIHFRSANPGSAEMLRIQRSGFSGWVGIIRVIKDAPFDQALAQIDRLGKSPAQLELATEESLVLFCEIVRGIRTDEMRSVGRDGPGLQIKFHRDFPVDGSAGFVAEDKVDFALGNPFLNDLLSLFENFHPADVLQPEMDQAFEIISDPVAGTLGKEIPKLRFIDRLSGRPDRMRDLVPAVGIDQAGTGNRPLQIMQVLRRKCQSGLGSGLGNLKLGSGEILSVAG